MNLKIYDKVRFKKTIKGKDINLDDFIEFITSVSKIGEVIQIIDNLYIIKFGSNQKIIKLNLNTNQCVIVHKLEKNNDWSFIITINESIIEKIEDFVNNFTKTRSGLNIISLSYVSNKNLFPIQAVFKRKNGSFFICEYTEDGYYLINKKEHCLDLI